MEITLLPAVFNAFAMGYTGAAPMPPPTQTAVPKFSICVGLPSGPTTSIMLSPFSRSPSKEVVFPTSCDMMVIVPSAVSESTMVKGILSPCSFTLIMINCPAFLFCAIIGAFILNRATVWESCLFSIISNNVISFLPLTNYLSMVYLPLLCILQGRTGFCHNFLSLRLAKGIIYKIQGRIVKINS